MQCPKCKKNGLNFKPWLGMIYYCRFCDYQGPVALKETKKKIRI